MFKATHHATRVATILHFLFLLLLPLPAFGQAYPNPSPGTFMVDAPGSAQTQACLWNILGKRLACAPVYGNGSGLSVEFSISAPPGVYFWRVGSLSGSIVTTGRAGQTSIRVRPFIPEQLPVPRFLESQTPTPPNVLLILADDMGYGDHPFQGICVEGMCEVTFSLLFSG